MKLPTFLEALAYAMLRKVVLPQEYYSDLYAKDRARAFTVSGITSLEQIAHVMGLVNKTLRDGGTFAEFQQKVRAADVKLPGYRLENVYRTNIQSAYGRGRWEQQQRHKHTRPYLMYDAINDSRTRPAHAAMDGVILHIDHPWWKTHSPPNGYQCRCTTISLTEGQVTRRGGVTSNIPEAAPDEGWTGDPADDGLSNALQGAVERLAQEFPQAMGLAEALARATRERANEQAGTKLDPSN